MKGRRRPDVPFGEIPDDPQPGDYWKYLDRKTGEVLKASDYADGHYDVSGNLTETVWGYYSPDGGGIGTLVLHTVREHADGTITVRPNDGSSNSIKHVSGSKEWHGFIYRGEWKPV